MEKAQISFAEFQSFIDTRYGEKDRSRGTARTFLWFMEEVGELASALQKSEDENAQVDLEGEFADVLGWLTTLANLHGVDLSTALFHRYLQDGGRNHKA
jgi:NTP pyrophosphatase (non-canonical NTP hydrolase)